MSKLMREYLFSELTTFNNITCNKTYWGKGMRGSPWTPQTVMLKIMAPAQTKAT